MPHTHAPRLTRLTLGGLVAVGALGACASPDDTSTPLTVAVSFFPVEELVRNVVGDAGDAIEIVPIVPAGADAHEYEPTPKQLDDLADADVVVLLGGQLQPGVERAVAELDRVTRVDLLDSVDLVDGDPHVWLSPRLMADMARAVADAIAPLVVDPAPIRANAAAYADALVDLDAEFRAGLAGCAEAVLVTAHDAFGYLARDYGLRAAPIAGISPSEEPSAATLAELAELASAEGVTTIFFEEALPDDLAATLAAEVGAATAVLDPIESPPADRIDEGATYLSLMRANLSVLQTGLGCG